MTYLMSICRPASTNLTGVSPDRSVTAIFFLLLALVFAPVIGLHVALAVSDTNPILHTVPKDGGATRHATALRG